MENNKLIAEFMDYEEQDMSFRIPKHILKIKQENDCPNSQDLDCWDVPLKSLQFHTSWDWLIPVVEKILNKSDDDELIERFYEIQNVIPNREATYKAVVQFIKLLNKKEV